MRRLVLVARPVGFGFAVSLLVAGLTACRPADAGAAGARQAESQVPLRIIQHEEPKRDSVGAQPARFRWSPIRDADRYAIGLWNDSDRLIWRQDDVREPTVLWPAGASLEPGTYFWSVSALQGGREIAKSGLAAFVVEQ